MNEETKRLWYQKGYAAAKRELEKAAPEKINDELLERLVGYIPKGDGYNSQFAHDLSKAIEHLAITSELLEALEAIIERWDTPLWKDVPHTAEYINRARSIVAKAKGEEL